MEPLIKKAYEASLKGQSFAFITVVGSTAKGTPRKTGAKMVVLSDGSSYGTIGGGRNEKAAIAEAMKLIKTPGAQPAHVTYDYFGHAGQSVCGGQINIFIEPFAARRHLVICGAGHIALPLSVIAKMLNFKVTIIDNRKEFANKKRFPHVDDIMLGPHAETLSRHIDVTPNTYVMIVTQGNEFDFECLKAMIKSKAAYIGVISSLAKRVKFFKRLRTDGISEKYLKRLSIPAGLDIGAQTPEEIAISIMAEITEKYNKAHKGTAKFTTKSRSTR